LILRPDDGIVVVMRNAFLWMSNRLTAEEQKEFWHRVFEYETAPMATHFQQLTDAGLELPAPDAMDDATLLSKLWDVFDALADIGVFVTSTNHLNDRDVYTLLWQRVLRDEVPLLPDDPHAAWHIDLLGGCSEDDIATFMKYYADGDERRRWLADFPDYAMPTHEDPPHDRDRHLPSPYAKPQAY
jgi:hypothetical protein